MLKELKDALKAEVELVKPIRQKIQTTHGRERYDAWNEKRDRSETRRYLHLACCFMRGTPYRKCEAAAVPPPSSIITGFLEQYGCASAGVDAWLDVAPVAVEKPVRVRRLYVVVRADLPPGAQAVQAAHAMREFAADYPEVEAEWHRTSNTVAFLSVPDEAALVALVEELRRPWHGGENHLADTFVSEFREPDLGGSLTAICVEPKGGWKLRKLPLALSEKAA